MAIHFVNGNSNKNYTPIPPDIMKQAAKAAATYDWTDDESAIEKVEGSSDKEQVDSEGYPKKFLCKKTNIVATRMYKESPVVYVKGELLTLTADEQTVRDIIT